MTGIPQYAEPQSEFAKILKACYGDDWLHKSVFTLRWQVKSHPDDPNETRIFDESGNRWADKWDNGSLHLSTYKEYLELQVDAAVFMPKNCIEWLVDNYDPNFFEKIDIFEMP